MSGRSVLWRVAELPTTKAGIERAFSYFIAGIRLGTVAQMVPSLHLGVANSPNGAAYLTCWLAAAAAAVTVSVLTLVRRRPLGTVGAAADFALACALLLLGPVVLAPEERLGTWVTFQPANALSVIYTSSGVRHRTLWLGGLLGVIACYVVYLGSELGGDRAFNAIGNILTYVVYALIARMFFGFTRRIAADADASRARAAELARREEERRGQVMMHNGVALMRLLTEPGTDDSRRRLIDQAEVELRRMRSYLRGRTPDEAGADGGADAESSVVLAAMIKRVCDRFADLNVDALLDLGAGLRLPTAPAEALERALESLLLNIRVHARAEAVVVHLDQDPDGGWRLTLRDDGVGFDPASVAAGVGLREVVVGELRLRGLDVKIDSASGRGDDRDDLVRPRSGAPRDRRPWVRPGYRRGPSMRPRVAVVDDASLIRDSFGLLMPGLEVVAAVANVEELLRLRPVVELVLLDLHLVNLEQQPDVRQGIAAIRAVTGSGYRVCVYSQEERRFVLAACIAAGASGIVSKALPTSRAEQLLLEVASSGTVVPQSVVGVLEVLVRRDCITLLSERQRQLPARPGARPDLRPAGQGAVPERIDASWLLARPDPVAVRLPAPPHSRRDRAGPRACTRRPAGILARGSERAEGLVARQVEAVTPVAGR